MSTAGTAGGAEEEIPRGEEVVGTAAVAAEGTAVGAEAARAVDGTGEGAAVGPGRAGAGAEDNEENERPVGTPSMGLNSDAAVNNNNSYNSYSRAPRAGGMLYGQQECWAGAVGALLQRGIEREAPHVDGGIAPQAQRFLDGGWARRGGVPFIVSTFCNDWARKPNDAIPAMVKIFNNMRMTSTKSVAEVLGFGNKRPVAAAVIGGLRFVEGRTLPVGHWTAVMWQDRKWIERDGDKEREIDRDALEDVVYWVWSRREQEAAQARRRAGEEILPPLPASRSEVPLWRRLGTGRPRKNQLRAFEGAYGGGEVADQSVNASKRDSGIIAGIWMLTAAVQAAALLGSVAPQKPAAPGVGALAWRCIYERASNTVVNAVRSFMKVAGVGTRRKPVEPQAVVAALAPGLLELGAQPAAAQSVFADGARTAPISDALFATDKVIVCSEVREQVSALKHTRTHLGIGAYGRVEAVVLSNPLSKAPTRPYVTIVRQRTTGGGAEAGNAFQRFDGDGTVSEVAPLGRLISDAGDNIKPVMVLYRIISTGVAQPRREGPEATSATAQQQPLTVEQLLGATRSVQEVVEDFRLGRSSFPLVAQLKGKHFREIKLRPLNDLVMTPLVRNGVVPKVHQQRQRILLDLQLGITEEMEPLPLTTCATHVIEQLAATGKRNKMLRATTTFRYMTSLSGAMQAINLYSNFPTGILLSQCGRWAAAMRAAEIAAKVDEPTDQPAMDYEAVDAAVKAATTDGNKQVASIIMMTWLCGARAGDISQILRKDVRFEPLVPGTTFQKVRILMSRGKAAKLAQAHTIYTIIPPQWRDGLADWMKDFAPEAPLFKRSSEVEWRKLSAAINKALQTTNRRFGQRALRRGALQTMAADPNVDLATLRCFSGHTNDEMLLRYLNWGMRANGRAQQAQEAARNLFAQDEDSSSSTSTTSSDTL